MPFSIEFKKLGSIDSGKIESNDLIIFFGANNAGKTYASYVLYQALKKKGAYQFKITKEIIDKITSTKKGEIDLIGICEENANDIKKALGRNIEKSLPDLFSSDEHFFSKTKISIPTKGQFTTQRKYSASAEILNEKNDDFLRLKLNIETGLFDYTYYGDIPDRIIGNMIESIIVGLLLGVATGEHFFLPAERAGINIFYSELNSRRTAILHQLKLDSIDPAKLIAEMFKSRYSRPVADYIDFLNEMPDLVNNVTEFSSVADRLASEILKGDFKSAAEQIYFIPEDTETPLLLHMSSSTSKSLFGLWFYLKHKAKKGDVLIIDEPELNLHPENQIKLINILAAAINQGLKITISTHSDYIIRQINILCLSNEKKSLPQNLKSYKSIAINKNRVNAYEFSNKTIEKVEFEPGEGFIPRKIDAAIGKQNEEFDHISLAR